jgi:hypothetical protein
MMNLDSLRLWYSRLLVVVFLGGLYFVLIRSADVGVFGLDTSLWGYRKLIAAYADLRLALGDRVFPNVLVGERGWLVFTAERSFDDYQNVIEFSDQQLAEITWLLGRLQERLAARGGTLLVVVAPNKPTVYPDIVPPQLGKLSETSRLDRLTAHLEQNLPGVLLDLRPVLAEGRKVRDVYYQTDTHWNDYGVFLAYQAILSQLAKSRPELAPYALDQFEFREDDPALWDLAANTGSVSLLEPPLVIAPRFENPARYRELQAGSRRLLMAWTENASQPRLLMYHDSFGPRLFGLLAMHFRESLSVPHYSGRSIWSASWVEQTSPDVVIIEIAERYLHDLETFLGQ